MNDLLLLAAIAGVGISASLSLVLWYVWKRFAFYARQVHTLSREYRHEAGRLIQDLQVIRRTFGKQADRIRLFHEDMIAQLDKLGSLGKSNK